MSDDNGKYARRSEHLFEFLRKFYVIRTSDHAAPLDERLRSNKTSAYANAGDFSVLRTPYPVASALCKRWFHTAVAILGVIYTVLFLLSLVSNLDKGTVRASCLRFTLKHLRGGPETQSAMPVLHSLGVTQNGRCRVRLGPFDPAPAREYVFRGEPDFAFNGFYLQSSNASTALDPSVFALHAASNCSSLTPPELIDWQLVGSSRRYIKTDGFIEWFLEPFWPAHAGRYAIQQVDLRHPWYFWLGNFLHRPCLALVSFFLCVIGTSQRPHLGSAVILVNLFVLLVGWSVFALMSIWDRQFRANHFPLQWLHPLLALLMLGGFRWGERYTPEISVFAGAWSTGYTVLEHFIMSDQSTQLVFDSSYLYGGHLFEAMLWVVLGSVMILLRRRAQTESWKLIQADARTYRDAWERLCGEEGHKEGLRRLDLLCKLLPPPAKELLQLRLFLERDAEATHGVRMIPSFIGRRRQQNRNAGGGGVSEGGGKLSSTNSLVLSLSSLSNNATANARPDFLSIRALPPHPDAAAGAGARAASGSGLNGHGSGSSVTQMSIVVNNSSHNNHFNNNNGNGNGNGSGNNIHNIHNIHNHNHGGAQNGSNGVGSRGEGSSSRHGSVVDASEGRGGVKVSHSLRSTQSDQSAPRSVEGDGRNATAVRPVTSLDQLYVQVRAWGLKSEGRCRVEGSNDFVLWTDVRAGRLEKRVKVAVLKKAERAVEKVIRAYKGKVARLCDVCRESLYFENIAQIVNCLNEIRSDPDVELLSVKNRYSTDYEDLKTAGYRDLNVNLRIVTEESEAIGVHLHICELQLILTEFASLKTESGHKRYVAYRNALGE